MILKEINLSLANDLKDDIFIGTSDFKGIFFADGVFLSSEDLSTVNIDDAIKFNI